MPRGGGCSPRAGSSPIAGPAFDTALAADPNSTEALGGRAVCAWLTGQVDQAVQRGEGAGWRSIPKARWSSGASNCWGWLICSAGHAQQAVAALLASDTAEPDRPGDVDSMTPVENGRLYLIAATSLAGDRGGGAPALSELCAGLAQSFGVARAVLSHARPITACRCGRNRKRVGPGGHAALHAGGWMRQARLREAA